MTVNTTMYSRSNIYDHVAASLPPDYKPEFVSAEFTTLCNDVINIHPHSDAGIQSLPQPQPQSSGASSSFKMQVDSKDQSSIKEVPGSSRSRRKRQQDPNAPSSNPSVYIVPNDGVYLLVVYIGATSNTQTYTASVHVEVSKDALSNNSYCSV